MQWPRLFRRRPPSSEPDAASDGGPAAPAAPGVQRSATRPAWLDAPPLRTERTEPPVPTSRRRFAKDLGTRQRPETSVEPLDHSVSPDARPGVVSGIATTRPAVTTRPDVGPELVLAHPTPDPPGPDGVQAAPLPRVERPVRRASSTDRPPSRERRLPAPRVRGRSARSASEPGNRSTTPAAGPAPAPPVPSGPGSPESPAPPAEPRSAPTDRPRKAEQDAAPAEVQRAPLAGHRDIARPRPSLGAPLTGVPDSAVEGPAVEVPPPPTSRPSADDLPVWRGSGAGEVVTPRQEPPDEIVASDEPAGRPTPEPASPPPERTPPGPTVRAAPSPSRSPTPNPPRRPLLGQRAPLTPEPGRSGPLAGRRPTAPPVPTGPAPRSRPGPSGASHHAAAPQEPSRREGRAPRGIQRATAPAPVRDAVQRRTGVDLGDVTIRRGPEVSENAAAMSARAFTVDEEVHLPDETGALQSSSSQSLLAHELTHVAQQRVLGSRLPDESSPAGQRLEAEAEASEHTAGSRPGAAQRAPLASRRGDHPDAARTSPAVAALTAGVARPDGGNAIVFAPPPGRNRVGAPGRGEDRSVQRAPASAGPVERLDAGTAGPDLATMAAGAPDLSDTFADADAAAPATLSSAASSPSDEEEDAPEAEGDEDTAELDELARKLWPRLHQRLRRDLLVARDRTGTTVDRL